ncbi:tetratricopeptide repeat protein [Streptomyces sp. DSM 110735]|uniref:tetratricopeptide repeat protein n=1 Tax=Streptomyces sp. DSM 110735 TaxID=2775031 RepID=UPI0018F492FB|nr:tetratricopeptide repeat protein [Streptomyces sp. DSM 110735]MBJ7901918.1 tetratricopeptide repeat protein [Streptomyces sp. DSM 110735]
MRERKDPAAVADGLGRRLAEARRTLDDGAAEEAGTRFAALLAEIEEQGEGEQGGFAPEHAAALLGLGESALETGELTDALGHFERAAELLADAPAPLRAPVLRGRAVAHYLSGELRYAVHLLETGVDELARAAPQDPDALVLLHAAAIGPYMDMGAHHRAARAAESALALAPRVSDPALLARTHRSVARTLLAQGRHAEADASLATAAELYDRLGLRTELAHCHWMRGYVRAQAGQLAGAEDELRRALLMLGETRAALYRSQVAVELADVLHRRGSSGDAAELLAGVLGDFSSERGAVHAAAAHRLLGIIAEDAHDTEAAEEHYVRALSLLERAGAAGDLADLCRLLGDLLRRGGRTEAALDAYRTGLGHRTAPGSTTLGPGRL